MTASPSPLASPGAPGRRRGLAALTLAVGLLLSACGGDDDSPAPREAYQPASSSSSAPASSASASSETADGTESEQPSSSASAQEAESSAPEPSSEPSERPSAAPAQEDCVGSDYLFTDLTGDIGCYDAKVTVEKVLNTGTVLGGGVADNDVKCTPEGSGWLCAQLGDTAFGITVQAKDPAKDPLQDILDSSSEDDDSAEPAAITCSGAAYEFSDVRGMGCSEALAILDPFADRRVPEGRSGGAQCSMDKQGGRELWSCSRDSGGSFTATSR